MPLRRFSPTVPLLVALATMAVGCTQAAPTPTEPPATSPSPTAPQEPIGGNGTSGDNGDPGAPIGAQPPGDPGQGDGALHVEPEPDIVDANPHAWDHIRVGPDGRTITIYYWGGVEDCYGLAGVDVQQDDKGAAVIRVMEGRRGALPADTMCIEIALLKAVTIELEQPLVAASQ